MLTPRWATRAPPASLEHMRICRCSGPVWSTIRADCDCCVGRGPGRVSKRRGSAVPHTMVVRLDGVVTRRTLEKTALSFAFWIWLLVHFYYSHTVITMIR